MEDTILELIEQITARKIEAKREPHYVLKGELFSEISTVLNNLYLQGKIKVGNTINDKWIKINGETE